MTTMELIEKGIGHNCLSDAYELGRADATKELPTRLYVDGFNDGYPKGKSDAIDKVVEYLKTQFLMQNNPNSKFVETIVLDKGIIDILEQLKEQK